MIELTQEVQLQLKTQRVGNHYLIGASFRRGGVAILAKDRTSLCVYQHTVTDCQDAFEISSDGRLLATGYHVAYPSQIDIWNTESGERFTTIPRTFATHLRFWPGGSHVIWFTPVGKGRTWLYDLYNEQTTQLKGASPNGAWTRDSKAYLAPMWHGGGGLRISLDPLRIERLPSPNKSSGWVFATNPNENTFIILERDRLSCLRVADCSVVWKRRAPNVGWVAFSGDGQYLALQRSCPDTCRPVAVCVVDPASGDTIRVIEQPEQARHPLDGSCVMCLSGKIINLETGEIDSGVSDEKWWRSLIEKHQR